MRCRRGASISISNAPTNGGRVPLLLQDKGVLKLLAVLL